MENEAALKNSAAHRILNSISDSTYIETVKDKKMDKNNHKSNISNDKKLYTKNTSELKKNEKINKIYVGAYNSNNIYGKSMREFYKPLLPFFTDCKE